MTEENCPTIGAMGVTSGTWMISDADDLVCLETGNLLRINSVDGKDVRMDIPGAENSFVLWSFKTKVDCEKKFEWLKEILMGSKP